MRHGYRNVRAAGVLLAVAMLLPGAASAKKPIKTPPPRPIRIEGYWERGTGAPGVLEGINVTSNAGGSPRIFGVTALQAYKPAEHGVQVLHGTGPAMAPGVTLRLLGDETLVRRFMDAPGTKKVVAHGVYRDTSGTLFLDSVKVGEAE
jgi:hypothetical protein